MPQRWYLHEQNKAHPTITRKNKLMVAPSNSNFTNLKKKQNKTKQTKKRKQMW